MALAAAVATVAGVAAAVAVLRFPAGVPVTAPAPDEQRARLCRTFVAALPQRVEGQPSRATSPRSELTAAWGEPAITVRCGVGRPAAYTPTAELVEVDGIGWFPQQTADGYRFTTVRRAADVEVRVPAAYAPETGALTDLAPDVAAHLPPLPAP